MGRTEPAKDDGRRSGRATARDEGRPQHGSWNRAMLLHVNRTWEQTPIPAVDHHGVQGWVHILQVEGSHTNVQTTINTYGHLFPNVRERIRAAFEDVWDAGQ